MQLEESAKEPVVESMDTTTQPDGAATLIAPMDESVFEDPIESRSDDGRNACNPETEDPPPIESEKEKATSRDESMDTTDTMELVCKLLQMGVLMRYEEPPWPKKQEEDCSLQESSHSNSDPDATPNNSSSKESKNSPRKEK